MLTQAEICLASGWSPTTVWSLCKRYPKGVDLSATAKSVAVVELDGIVMTTDAHAQRLGMSASGVRDRMKREKRYCVRCIAYILDGKVVATKSVPTGRLKKGAMMLG